MQTQRSYCVPSDYGTKQTNTTYGAKQTPTLGSSIDSDTIYIALSGLIHSIKANSLANKVSRNLSTVPI